MSNPFNILTVMNVFARHTVRCPKCKKKNYIAKANEQQDIICKHCGYKYVVKTKG